MDKTIEQLTAERGRLGRALATAKSELGRLQAVQQRVTEITARLADLDKRLAAANAALAAAAAAEAK